jgi:photosystem II stability/assembly factor-like uncharacterized protein
MISSLLGARRAAWLAALAGAFVLSVILFAFAGALWPQAAGAIGWHTQDPGVTDDIVDISFGTDEAGFAITATQVLTTEDGGAHWSPVTAPGSGYTAVHFVDGQHGWIACTLGQSFLATADGGATWSLQKPPVPGYYEDVFFRDAQHGWVVGADATRSKPVVVRTTDGGAHWSAAQAGDVPAGQYPLRVTFSSAQTGWMGGTRGMVQLTTDGGATWFSLSGDQPLRITVRDICFTDARHGWVVGTGDGGAAAPIWSTNDGGRSWKTQDPGKAGGYTTVAMAADGLQGWVLGLNGAALQTTDGGATWVSRPLPAGYDIVRSDCRGADRIWAAGTGGTILKYGIADHGTWRRQDSGTTAQLMAVDFADARHGWAVGANGVVRATSDGGATWVAQSGSKADLLCVSFVDALHGFAAGTTGTTQSSSDGGASWQVHKSGLSLGAIYGLCATSASTVWGAGFEAGQNPPGFVIVSRDGGSTWRPNYSHGGGSYFDVDFSDPLNGWVVGYGGTFSEAVVLHTADGGASWQVQDPGTAKTIQLMGVDFVDAQHGWAVGNGDTVRATTDGGAHWVNQNMGGDWWSDVAAVDPANAFIVGRAGILWTSTGGSTWNVDHSGGPFNGVDFVDDAHAWAVGDGGAIYRYEVPSPEVTIAGPHRAWSARPVALELRAHTYWALDVRDVQVRVDGAKWVAAPGVGALRTLSVGAEGKTVIEARCTDEDGRRSRVARVTVRVDTSRPRTFAAAASGRAGHAVPLRYKVLDRTGPRSMRATIVVRNARGRVVETIRTPARRLGAWHSCSWVPRARGLYSYSVLAVDRAGNHERVTGRARLIVR